MELKVTLGPAVGGHHSHHGAGNVVSSQSISFAFLLSVLLKKALLANGLHGKFYLPAANFVQRYNNNKKQ